MYTKTGEEKKTTEDLLAESRDEARELRRRVVQYENIVLSTRLLMGHELRRPTTVIAGYLDLVAEDMEKQQNSDTLALVEKARAACDLLCELKALYVELLQFDSDDVWVGKATTILDDVVGEIIEGFPAEFDAANRVVVNIATDVPVLPVNRKALRLILTNLIENALLYSQTVKPVRVEATMEQSLSSPEGPALLIEVSDEGGGIPDDFLDKVFDPFVRLRPDVAEGSGLGLTLVKSLVELSNGNVTIDSEWRKSTKVRVMIPVAHTLNEEHTR